MKISAMCWETAVSPLLLMFLLSGCVASFQGNQLDPVSGYPAVIHQKTIFIKVAFTGKLDGEKWPQNDVQNQTYLKRKCMEELEASGLFALVSDELYTTDLRLYVAIVNEKETRASNKLLSALSLFIVPYTSTDTFRLMAILKDPSTGREEQISLTDRVNHRQHLLMFPFAPFKSSGSELTRCTDRLLENLCLEIHRTGMLQ